MLYYVMSTESLNTISNEIKTPNTKLDINSISAETLNTTTDEIKNLNVQLNVLKKKNTNSKSKKICIHTLNKRLYLARKKDKFRNLAILSAIFVSVGLVGFIAG